MYHKQTGSPDHTTAKIVTKGMKSEFHKLIATFVFSINDDANICVDFHSNTVNYTGSIDNYITW